MDTAKFGQWSFVILRTPRIHEHLTLIAESELL